MNAFSTTSSDKGASFFSLSFNCSFHELSFFISALSVNTDTGDDEEEGTAYKYWFLHLVFVLAGLYMAALLTNWAVFHGEAFTGGDFCVDEGVGSMWAKAATSWLVALLFIWTLFAPVLMPDRFGNN